ncbi:MAG: NAD(P)-dependent oxidoreductase [Micrococcales bacterium]|nr:NAD(P)-dependent oxidoreductase [Micrococcales bacterium]
MRLLVTGASGKLGSVVAAELAAAGHDVLRIDQSGARSADFVQVDLTDYGQVADAMHGVDDRASGFDAVVHLAALPSGGLAPDSATFHNNMNATFNVFQAARRAGIDRIVYASSETLLGIPFETPPPYLPVDEEYPTRPESMYSLVKHLEEELARKLVRWNPQLSITGLRFSNVMVPADYAGFAAWQDDPAARRWNLWGYIDARDAAQAIGLALEHSAAGFETYVIANADTVMERPSAELAAAVFPEVELRHPLEGRESLLSIEKAKRMLGYAPRHSWRDGA